MGKNSFHCASTLNNIGLFYKKQGKYELALENYFECLDIEQRIKGKDSIDCAFTLHNIGLVCN